jgi:hypothetical protein
MPPIRPTAPIWHGAGQSFLKPPNIETEPRLEISL